MVASSHNNIMEHAKKMVLVDPQFYRPSITEKALNGLDGQISSILSSDLPDDVKAKRYAEAVRRYGNIKEAIIEPVETKKLTETDVLDSISSVSRHKAKRLLDYLKSDGNVHFKANGEVVYKNETLHGSNIVDLLDNAANKSASDEKAKGLEEFANALKEINAPRSTVENNALWKLIHRPPKTHRKSRQAKGSTTTVSRTKHQSPAYKELGSSSPVSRPRRVAAKTQRWLAYEDSR